MTATLPEGRYQHRIRDMELEESAWTVPWAIRVDHGGCCYLDPDYMAEAAPGGTVAVLITREVDGYTADITRWPQYRWTRGEFAEPGLIPLWRLITEPE